MLRERFGSEYDRTVETHDGQRAAEAELRGRERERARLDIKPLSEASRVRYSDEWRTVQQSFVDQPEGATTAAYELVNRVMAERGYPMSDFDAQADLVSVDHPDVVQNYRVAHGIHERAQRQEASTEDLREAMLRYRSLFEELLRAGDGNADDAAMAAGASATGARQTQDTAAVGDGGASAQPVTSRPGRAQDTVEGETGDDTR